MTSTKQRLAEVLESAGLTEMADRARGVYYDDYESEVAMPIVQLVADLEARGHHALAKRARAGEWDGTQAEAEAWAERQTDPEMRAVIEKLRAGAPKVH